jgi:hypothetical protein
MRVMQTQLMDLFTIMDCHFQRSIGTAVNMAVIVRMTLNAGDSEYQSTCAYYYSFLFSGWWFNYCTNVALNGKYNAPLRYGFFWNTPFQGIDIVPIRSEMKIRRQ